MKNEEKIYSAQLLELAHKGCSSHKEELESSELCGCFFCKKTFETTEIKEWIKEKDNKETAICPKCGIDSVLSSKYPIEDKSFLSEMNHRWF